MKPDLINKLNSSEYGVASHYLDEFLNEGNVTEKDITTLLSLENTLIIGDFLEKYKNFKENDLRIIESYINRNLDNSDRLFVSDLIEFSTSWCLYLPYEKCLSFLKRQGDDDDYVLLASIDYIFENLKLYFIEEIYKLLNDILHNPESNQSAQVKAAFVLFRITNKKNFLVDLIDLVVNGVEDNKLLLSNMLSLNHNNSLYFEFYDVLKSISLQIDSNSDEVQSSLIVE